MVTKSIDVEARLDEIVSQYRALRFALVRRFISREMASSLLAAADGDPVREVICQDDNVRFGEQDFFEGHPIFEFFRSDLLLPLARRALQKDDTPELLCWTSVYGLGQYINPHKDIAGDVQIIVCLQAPAQEHGGALFISLPEGEQEVILAPGDAVIFKASALTHRTTPLIATPDNPAPKRAVAVGRYTCR